MTLRTQRRLLLKPQPLPARSLRRHPKFPLNLLPSLSLSSLWRQLPGIAQVMIVGRLSMAVSMTSPNGSAHTQAAVVPLSQSAGLTRLQHLRINMVAKEPLKHDLQASK